MNEKMSTQSEQHPNADKRSALARAADRYHAIRALLGDNRAELAQLVVIARDAGISHRAIAGLTGIPTMTVHTLEKEGRQP